MKEEKKRKPNKIVLEYWVNPVLDIADIEEILHIDWSEVDDFGVKWDALFIKMNDGRVLTYKFPHYEEFRDFKRPDNFRLEHWG